MHVGYIVMIYKVRRRTESDNALGTTERPLGTLVDSMPAYIIRFDRDRRHLFVNPPTERMYGIPAGDFIHRRVRKTIRSNTAERYD